MAKYKYEAKDINGKLIKGTVEAGSDKEAARIIASQGLFLINLKKEHSRFDVKNAFDVSIFHKRDLMIFCRELAIMLNTGMNLVDCLQILRKQASEKWKQKMISSISTEVQNGNLLSDAMKKQGSLFSKTFIALVHAGEISGTLDTVLNKLAAHEEKRFVSREKFITLLTYPAILMCIMFFVLIFVINFLLPTFASLFVSLKAELPLPTKVLLQFSSFVSDYWFLFMAAFAFAIIIFIYLLKIDAYRLKFDQFAIRLPLIGRFLMYHELIQITGTLSLLLTSGLIMDQAILVLSDATSNSYIKKILLLAKNDVQRGEKFSSSMARWGIFPDSMMELMMTGEKTGELEFVLDKIAEFSQIEADNLSERMKSLVEPMAILFLGCVAGFIVFAVALPIIDAIGTFSE